eukprot:4548845-Prymnesium_polylepis.1
MAAPAGEECGCRTACDGPAAHPRHASPEWQGGSNVRRATEYGSRYSEHMHEQAEAGVQTMAAALLSDVFEGVGCMRCMVPRALTSAAPFLAPRNTC